MASETKSLIGRIAALPPERIAEVEDFVDSLGQRETDRALARDAAKMSTPALAAVWDNPEDDVYDAL